MIEAKALRLVGTVCPDMSKLAEFNEWYNHVHIPEVLSRIPGAKTAARFEMVNPKPGEPQYIALYEIEGAPPDSFEKYNAKVHAGEVPDWKWGPPVQVVWRGNLKRIPLL